MYTVKFISPCGKNSNMVSLLGEKVIVGSKNYSKVEKALYCWLLNIVDTDYFINSYKGYKIYVGRLSKKEVEEFDIEEISYLGINLSDIYRDRLINKDKYKQDKLCFG